MATVPSQRGTREQLERNALRLLCSHLIEPATRVRLTLILDASLFQTDLHRAVYEEIRALGGVPARKLRELLPGRMSCRGFCEFRLKEFLAVSEATEDDIEKLFESVLEMVEQEQVKEERAKGQTA